MSWRVLVVDDNPIVRLGLAVTLADLPEVVSVVEAADGAEALRILERGEVDVALLDVRMPVKDGLAVLTERRSEVPVLMLTHSDEPAIIRQALDHGAQGYLIHGTFDTTELASALTTAMRGGAVLSAAAARTALTRSHEDTVPDADGEEAPRPDLGLTTREVELMACLAQGLSNAEIAGRLFLSEKTVKNHLGRIYAKLGVAGRGAAIVRWLER